MNTERLLVRHTSMDDRSQWKGYLHGAAAIECRVIARDHRRAPWVIALIDHGNFASQAVAKRNGMTHEQDTVHRCVPAMVWRVMLDQPLRLATK
jgi:hypothetical protein